MKNKQPKKTALYCRLSVDDGRLGESVSIESQKILLVQYCKDHAIYSTITNGTCVGRKSGAPLDYGLSDIVIL